jgi:hypothetical protein
LTEEAPDERRQLPRPRRFQEAGGVSCPEGFTSGGAAIQVVALCIAGGVRAVYMTNNPEKLARWSVAEVE